MLSDRTSGSSPPSPASPRPRTNDLRRLIAVRLPKRLSLRAAILLSVWALLTWGLSGWVFLEWRPRLIPYLIAAFLVGTAFTLAYMIIMHPLADRGNGEQVKLKRVPGQVGTTGVALLISSAIVYLLDNQGGLIRRFFDWLGQALHLLVDGERVVAVGLHVWFLGIFFVFSVPHWVRHARHSVGRPLVDEHGRRHATTPELIARDLIAGSVLLGALALICQMQVYAALVDAFARAFNVTPAPPPVTAWTVSWYLGDQASFATLDPLTTRLLTITVTDIIAALAFFAVGGTVVAVAEIAALLARGNSLDEVVWKIIHGIISPWTQIAALLQQVLVSARRAIWPALIFVAVLCLSVVARYIGLYLADLNTLHSGDGLQAWVDTGFLKLLIVVMLASAAALLILAAIIVQFFRRENERSLVGSMPAYWLPELWRIGLVVLFCTGLIAVALSALDGLLNFVQVQVLRGAWHTPHPFFPLGLVTYFAFLEFVAIAALTFRDRGRGGAASEQAITA